MGIASCYSYSRPHRPGFDISDRPTLYFLAPLSAAGSRSQLQAGVFLPAFSGKLYRVVVSLPKTLSPSNA